MSEKPIRIQRKRTKGWKMPPNTVYVGRTSAEWGAHKPFANPFRIGGYFRIGTARNGFTWLEAHKDYADASFTKIETQQQAVDWFREYREPGKPVQALPGQPGDAKFQAAYDLAAAGQPIRAKPTRRHAPVPRTLRAAWLEVQKTGEWHGLKASSKIQQIGVAERFFEMPIAPKEKLTFGQMPVSGIRRGDIKKILGRFSAHPHAGEAVLRLLRKLTLAAMDLEWIESDPTYRIKFRPKTIGHRAWTDEELVAYEARWPIGTTERLGYALALYTGQRRSDVAPMRWDAINGGGVAVLQEKTDTPLWIPIHPELKIVLDATPQVGETVLTTAYGKPFSTYGFGGKMADAIGLAKLPDACRLHGLRKSAGRCLAEAGATTRQIMAILGHKSLSEAERYTREAAQRKLAQEGIDHWAKPKLTVVK